MEKPDIDIELVDSWTQYKNVIREKIYKRWHDRWKGEFRFRLTKLFYPEPSKMKAKQLFKKTRKQTTLWVELITGQNNLNYVQSKVKNISPDCIF